MYVLSDSCGDSDVEDNGKKYRYRKWRRCLEDSICLESLVIVLTIVSCVATTCKCLFEFEILSVVKDIDTREPQNRLNTINSSHFNWTKPSDVNSSTPSHLNWTMSNYLNSTTSNFNVTNTSKSNLNNSSDLDSETVNISIEPKLKEIDEDILDVLENVFQFTNLGITALFFLEIMSKFITLRAAFIKKALQVFDVMIVLLSVAFQATFFAISLPEVTYCISYIILLRLWRICYICNCVRVNKRANDVLRSKCVELEYIAKLQMERIEELKERETDIDHETNDVTVRYNPLYHELGNQDNIQDNNNRVSPLPDDIKGTYYSGQTEKINDTKAEQPIENDAPCSMDSKIADDNDRHAAANVDMVVARSQTNNGSPNSGVESKAKNNVKVKLWRRSSTSQLVDLKMSLPSNDDIKFPQLPLKPSSSCSDILNHDLHLDSVVDEKPNSEIPDGDVDDVDGGKSWENSKDFEMVEDGEEDTRKTYQFRRQNSCPDYMFTDRMKLTKYESMLIEDDYISQSHAFDNEAFSEDTSRDDPMNVLHKHSSSGTYRSQKGVPTTEL